MARNLYITSHDCPPPSCVCPTVQPPLSVRPAIWCAPPPELSSVAPGHSRFLADISLVDLDLELELEIYR